jgi:hypothetical protein
MKYFLVGVVGDITLQLIVYNQGNFAGLKSYFNQHSPFENVILAGGIMQASKIIFDLTSIHNSYINLFMFGCVVDLAFRYGRLFPSLDEFYETLPVWLSASWGGICMILPELIKFK